MGNTTISITDETYRRLANHGTYGDSMDGIITKLLDNADKAKEAKANA